MTGDLSRRRPPRTEQKDGTKHHVRIERSHAARSRGEIEHAVDLPPGPVLEDTSDIVNDGGITVASLERSTDKGPEDARDGRTVDDRILGSNPHRTVWLDKAKVGNEPHPPAVIEPFGLHHALKASVWRGLIRGKDYREHRHEN